jgi:hypothetical protein
VASSAYSSSVKVRLGLLGIVAKESHPAARRIVQALWLLCIAVLVLAVSQMATVTLNVEQSQRRIGTVLTNQRRSDLVAKAGVIIQATIVSLETGQVVAPPAIAAAALLQIAEDLEFDTNRIIRDFKVLSVGSSGIDLEASKITLGEFSPLGDTLPLQLSLTDACLWFVSHLRRAAPEIATSNVQHPSVGTVLQAAQLVLRSALAQSGVERTKLYAQSVKEEQAERIVQFTFVFSIMVFVTAGFVVWQMYRLDAHRALVLGVLRAIPRSQASGMKELTSTNLLRQANENGPDMMDIDAKGPALDDSGAPLGLSASNRAQRSSKPDPVPHDRPWKTGLRFKCSNGLVLCTPVLIVGALLLSVFFTRESFRVQTETSAQTALLAHELTGNVYLFSTYTSGIGSPSVLAQLASTIGYTSLVEQFSGVRQALLTTLSSIVKGADSGPLDGVSTKPLQSGNEFTTLFLGDACSGFTQFVPGIATTADCRAAGNGILQEAGLQGGILELVSLGARGYNVFVELARANVTLSAAARVAATSDVISATKMVVPFLSTIGRRAATSKTEELDRLSETEVEVLIAAYCLYVLVLWSSVGFYFVPRARALGQQVTAAQVVLPMLPPFWVENTPALRKKVEFATKAVILGTPDRAAAKQGRLVEALAGAP